MQNPIFVNDLPPRRRPLRIALVVALLLLPLLAVALWAKGKGYKTWALVRLSGKHVLVTQSRPAHGDTNVPQNAFLAADVRLPHFGLGINAKTLSEQNVRLYRASDNAPVPFRVNTSGAGDAIVLTPTRLLDPETRYTFEVTPGVTDELFAPARPYRATFTTGRGQPATDFPVAFEQVPLPLDPGTVVTALAVGPDHHLYAATFDGRILRWTIKSDGTLGRSLTISTVQANNQGPRLIVGLAFHPDATPDNLVAYVTHGIMGLENMPDWTTKLSRLSGPELGTYRDLVVHLPRAYKDHLANQPAFGPDGALYFCQGSNTAMGAADMKWGWRPERALTAAILRADVAALEKLDQPLDAKTEDDGHYDPHDPGAPLTLHATGVRVGYDMLWHSAGHLYTAVNGAAAHGNVPGTPHGHDGPAVPELRQLDATQPDFLLHVLPGRYYGHPNPARRQYVLNGGNPTAGRDPAEVPEYPVGTRPDPAWHAPAYDFGKNVSPNGLLEYTADTFGDQLKGKILVTRYSGGDDILVLSPNPDGSIAEVITGIPGFTGFSDPLDLTLDPRTGNLYVAEFSGQKLTLLRPIKDPSKHPKDSPLYRHRLLAQTP